MNAYELARIADVASPDSLTSPGAQWLCAVAGSASDIADADSLTECADALVPVYTHERWQVFVDLCAYRDDLSDAGLTTCDDMTSTAGVALYVIAERLLSALVSEEDAA